MSLLFYDERTSGDLFYCKDKKPWVRLNTPSFKCYNSCFKRCYSSRTFLSLLGNTAKERVNINILSKTSKRLRTVLNHFYKIELDSSYFLSMQLSSKLLYPCHLTYKLSTFLLSTFSIQNFYWLVFCNSFS